MRRFFYWPTMALLALWTAYWFWRIAVGIGLMPDVGPAAPPPSSAAVVGAVLIAELIIWGMVATPLALLALVLRPKERATEARREPVL